MTQQMPSRKRQRIQILDERPIGRYDNLAVALESDACHIGRVCAVAQRSEQLDDCQFALASYTKIDRVVLDDRSMFKMDMRPAEDHRCFRVEALYAVGDTQSAVDSGGDRRYTDDLRAFFLHFSQHVVM